MATEIVEAAILVADGVKAVADFVQLAEFCRFITNKLKKKKESGIKIR